MRSSTQRLVVVGGLLYLIIIVTGVAGQAAIRGPLVDADPAQTVANLANAGTLFRLSILGDVLMILADVALGVVLYKLLKPVSPTLSVLAMAFRLAQAAVLGANLVHLQQAITLVHEPVVDVALRDALVARALDAHAVGYDIGLFFFAINCLLVGYLIGRGRRSTRILGAGMILSGLVYLAGSTLRIVAPELSAAFAPAYAIPLVAELGLCLALCFSRGVLAHVTINHHSDRRELLGAVASPT